MLRRHSHRLGLSAAVPNFSLKEITVLGALGRGAKGVVFLVRTEYSGEFLALKVILKELIEKKRKSNDKVINNDDDVNLGVPAAATLPPGTEYRRICFEQEVLSLFQHPLLPRLRGVFSTNRVLGYAIDYCSGGDLGSLRRKQTEKMFSDDVIRFYAAELVLALEYVHGLGIVYRDLKPENILIQENGHIMLVDFDLSTKLLPRSYSNKSSPLPQSPSLLRPPNHKSTKKKRLSFFRSWCNSGISPLPTSPQQEHKHRTKSGRAAASSGKSNSFVGTEEYVAPEIILGKGHDFAVDWWSLGIVLYEMLYGQTPFRGFNRKETFYRILSKSPDLVGEATSLRGLIRKLLVKDPTLRIELEEIKGHDFFRGVDWDSVTEMSRPPYIPNGAVTEEDTEGIKKVDVESFVQGIFGSEKENRHDDCNDAKLHDDRMVEVQVSNPHHNSSEAYLVF